jgi:GxxExxY protein
LSTGNHPIWSNVTSTVEERDEPRSRAWTWPVGIGVSAVFGTQAYTQSIRSTLEHSLPVEYKGLHFDCGYRIDLLVENEIILELKSVAEIKGIHQAQLLTCMKLAGIKQGFLMNFNMERLAEGPKSFVA